MRSLSELLDTTEPAWPMVRGWMAQKTNDVRALRPTDDARRAALHAAQVTIRSPMGAVIYETGGILVDGGWLRILGSGSPELPRSLPTWNQSCAPTPRGAPPPFLLVADDVVGGFYAIDGGGLGGQLGAVRYLAPDTLVWEEVAPSYTNFLEWTFSGDIAGWYKDLRWPGWRRDIVEVRGDQAYTIYPFLWADGPPIGERTRGAVSVSETWLIAQHARSQFEVSGSGSLQ